MTQENQNEDQNVARIEREAEINKVPPKPETNTGPDTTGVGQPTAQAVNQGQSLPAASIPVNTDLSTDQGKFHDPMVTERAALEKDKAERGGQKADF
jgi:hypothetical protein